MTIYSLDILFSQFFLNQSIVPCPVLTVATWPAYRFLRRQVRWSSTHISLRTFHSLLWFTQNERLSRSHWGRSRCFSGNFISGSSAFCTSESFQFIYCWSLVWSVLSITLLACEGVTCVVVRTFFGTAFLWDCNENWSFPVLWPLFCFANLLAYWLQHFN